jgi:hypothetical protein
MKKRGEYAVKTHTDVGDVSTEGPRGASRLKRQVRDPRIGR